jgi:hypothetical protein
MVSGGMADRRIRIRPTPSKDGDAINDEVARAHQTPTQSGQHREKKEGFWQWCSRLMSPLPLVRSAGITRTAVIVHWQPASHRQSGPVPEPVVPLLI